MTSRPEVLHTVFVRGKSAARLDGCGARRGHFLSAMGQGARVVELPEAPAGSFAAVLSECVRGEGSVLFFYPELPFLQRVTWVKAPIGLLLFLLVRMALALRRRRMVFDVVDIVRWQEISLHLGRRTSPRVIRAVEGILFRMADEIWLPSHELARWLVRDLALAERRFRVVPHLPPPAAASAAQVTSIMREVPSPLRFVYVGGLSLDEDRGIRQLVDAFRREAPAWAELHLAGERGEWLKELRPVPGLHHHGLLGEESLAVLVRKCDFGLIPYPEWGYYRTVLPAKLSFYESCGVEVVSTELPEVRRWIEGGGRGRILPYRRFASLFRELPERLA